MFTKWRELALLFSKYRLGILLPVQAVFIFIQKWLLLLQKCHTRMIALESSKAHRDATITLCKRTKASGHVDSLLIKQGQAKPT